MGESAIIGLCAGAFAAVTWLLAVSFFLGRYAARVDSVAQSIEHFDRKFEQIFDKLDNLTARIRD